ncbi:MAG: hypothetical protein CVV42_04390 [Candidatus Riflebacteria bacterium HGW-Riflebacteria-2]|jgi:molecular chaperone GrpE (heat shock protein)|nr:MAG: hypothetical protein CVV42_04390 [Candidatus Riflebacteria bacterium HGW-Riflebacteria-2]
MNLESNGEISNEFFKKLNQQIVQKDNLIKLLQLQIRNLKTQLESGGAGGEGVEELKRALEEKSEAAERLLSELNGQKDQFAALEQQKNDQIKTLSQLLEEQQGGGGSTEVIDDARVQELEALVSGLREELESEKQARLIAESASVSTGAGDAASLQQEIESLKQAVEVARAELEQSNAAMQQMSAQLQVQGAVESSVPAADMAEYQNKIQELEQDVVNLKNLLAEKEDAGGGMTVDQLELEQLRARVAELEAGSGQPGVNIDEIERLRQESSQLAEANAKLATLQKDADSFTETAMKVTVLESDCAQLNEKVAALEIDREKLVAENEALKATAGEVPAEDVGAYKLEIVKLRETLQQREDELARLRVSLESRQDESMNDPAIREEVEQLTQQVADQMLAIQNFEGILSKTRDQLEARTLEVENLKARLGSNEAPVEEKTINVEGDSDIVSSFIDFFDGLDSVIAKNPVPELQMLHQKLLERLIIPNQISYMPVIAESYDSQKHYATDYFRSDKFPERCIVFEVEKGYLKGDSVIKKSKVWVVQNLYDCNSCHATQSNPDSRFCHMCGAKITAPNGLPVDSLPEFEPTPITYQRFADSMLRHGNADKAREYLMAGLDLDGNFAPIMTRLAEILAHESKFADALELLQKANTIKPDAKTRDLIQAIETKLNIFKQAQSLKLAPEEFEKLLNLIQK